ncbi:SDR family oxidoreductase [Microbacterium sp. 179-I 3D3 NHS]|uniref:SDR family oxidoreductase n=1 Tax=unclassified Microbacterium TaxID=2609290 RepID=UPI00399FAA22
MSERPNDAATTAPRTPGRLRPLRDQVVVVTGGSSGIGRETAVRMARSGATVVVIARDEERLAATVAAITADGGEARYILCDVSDAAAVAAAADTVEGWFGRIDTWVNNAGVLVYGRFEETSPAEFQRLMEVNFLGQIHGAQAALPALRRAGGGALIAVSSVEASTALPLHSAYAATKRAVEGAMQVLRRELRDQRDPISLTIIRPAVIDTPIYANARSHLQRRPSGPPPYYDASVVADAILYAAAHPVAEVYAGGGGRMLALLQAAAPGAIDAVFGRWGVRMMHTAERLAPHPGNLAAPQQGELPLMLPRRGRRWSVYTGLAVRPGVRRVVVLATAALAAGAVARAARSGR